MLANAFVPQGSLCFDNCMCCDTEIGAADQTFYLTQLQCTDTGSPSSKNNKIIIILIIALRGANRDFNNLLTAPRTVSNMYAQVARA